MIMDKLSDTIQKVLGMDDATFASLMRSASVPRAHDMALRKLFLYGSDVEGAETILKRYAIYLDRYGQYPETDAQLNGGI
jgi:hypothetical protein